MKIEADFSRNKLSQLFGADDAVPLLALPGKSQFEGHKAVFLANCKSPPIHCHDTNLLVQVYSGRLCLHTHENVTLLGPGDFFFTPAHQPHTEIFDDVDTTVGLLKVPDSLYPLRPLKPTALVASPFLKALYDEIILWSSSDYQFSSQKQKVLELFADYLAGAKAVQCFSIVLPPFDPLLGVAKRLVHEPENRDSLDQWAARAKMSRRTFSRTFREVTGYSFMKWRLRLKIAIAMKRLGQGDDVKTVSYELGFRHLSHFASEFRSQTGTSPSHFMDTFDLWNIAAGIGEPDAVEMSAVKGEYIYESGGLI